MMRISRIVNAQGLCLRMSAPRREVGIINSFIVQNNGLKVGTEWEWTQASFPLSGVFTDFDRLHFFSECRTRFFNCLDKWEHHLFLRVESTRIMQKKVGMRKNCFALFFDLPKTALLRESSANRSLLKRLAPVLGVVRRCRSWIRAFRVLERLKWWFLNMPMDD